MSTNQFFTKKGPFPLKEIIKNISCNGDFSDANDFEIYGVESLLNATKNDMTFLNSSKYKNLSLKTNAAACITTSNLSKFLPNNCIKLDVKNTLFAVTQVSRMFYPKADIDYPDANLLDSSDLKKLYLNPNSSVLTIFELNNFLLKNIVYDSKSTVNSSYTFICGVILYLSLRLLIYPSG